VLDENHREPAPRVPWTDETSRGHAGGLRPTPAYAEHHAMQTGSVTAHVQDPVRRCDAHNTIYMPRAFARLRGQTSPSEQHEFRDGGDPTAASARKRRRTKRRRSWFADIFGGWGSTALFHAPALLHQFTRTATNHSRKVIPCCDPLSTSGIIMKTSSRPVSAAGRGHRRS